MRRPRSRLARARGGEEEDRISGLPTDLLLRILARVCDARTVARTALVSRRWRGLWALLPEFHLSSGRPISTVLARLKAARDAAELAPPDLIHIAGLGSNGLVASWLRSAADLAPKKLCLIVIGPNSSSNRSVQLPCLDRTKSIELSLKFFRLTLPPAGTGDFLALERLVVKECCFDAAALLPRCPRLRALEVGPEAELDWSVAVNLPVLEELVVMENMHLARFHIVAPMLKYLSLSTHIRDASVSAPNLEKLSLNCSRNFEKIELGNMGQLQKLNLFGAFGLNLFSRLGSGLLWIDDGVGRLLQQLPHLQLLEINIAMRQATIYDSWLQKLPKTSILKLHLSARGHEFGAIVLPLLQMVEGVEELKMLIDSPKETCSPGCPCRYRQFRTSLSLPLLKNVEFKGYTGAKSAVYVMELIFSSAKALEQMTLGLAKGIQPTMKYASSSYLTSSTCILM